MDLWKKKFEEEKCEVEEVNQEGNEAEDEDYDFSDILVMFLEVMIHVITLKIEVTSDFSFEAHIERIKEPVKIEAFQSWMIKKFGYMRAILLVTVNQYKSDSEETKIDLKTPKKFTFNVDNTMDYLGDREIELMRNLPKDSPAMRWITGDDGMISLALNEIFFYGQYSKIVCSMAHTMDSELYQRFEDIEQKLYNVQVNEVNAQSQTQKVDDDFLIDLRSRYSKHSLDSGRFSLFN